MTLILIVNKLKDEKISFKKSELKTISKLLNINISGTVFNKTSVTELRKILIKQLKFDYQFFSYGIKGKRDYMEDRHFVNVCDSNIISGIFDGHGGDKCSSFFKNNYSVNFYKKLNETQDVKKSMIKTLQELNTLFLNMKTTSGSTANVFFIELMNKKIHNINLGDSRSIIGYKNKVRVLSKDHKTNLKSEKKYIERRGGTVKNNRLQGILSMSRAVGDKDLSKYINDTPNYYSVKLTDDVLFVLHGSDGLFDVMTNKEIYTFVIKSIKKNKNVNEITKTLIERAFNLGSKDNISVSLIIF